MSDDSSDIPFADSTLLTYVIPFAGSLLIAMGIAAGVVGAYSPVQQELGLCDEPTITVYTAEETVELTSGPDGDNLSLERLDFDRLSDGEKRAFEDALSDPGREGHVTGEFPNRAAFERGVLIRADGTARYATLTSNNQCAVVDPLLFPLGVAAILLGTVWILAPPMYRRFAVIEGGTQRVRD